MKGLMSVSRNSMHKTYMLNENGIDLCENQMIKQRSGAASVILNNGYFWIVGGIRIFMHSDGPVDPGILCRSSTEFFSPVQPSIRGPEMPFTIAYHSMVQISESRIFILGGELNGLKSNKTWIAKSPFDGFEIEEGPPMNFERSFHCSGMMMIGNEPTLIVAGGKNSDTVEILNSFTNSQWMAGE